MATKQQEKSDPRRDTRQRVLALHQGGATKQEIAKALGVSPQRVGQHLADLRRKGELR